MIWKIASPPAV